MRIAFVTPEFPTTMPGGGGAATYINRMGQLLAREGHEVEVFVAAPDRSDRITYGAITVTHVKVGGGKVWGLALGALGRMGFSRLTGYVGWERTARMLANAVERGHGHKPFDIVQSADLQAVGLKILKRSGRRHLVRCSVARDLLNACDGHESLSAKHQARREMRAVAEADIAYAPSKLVAAHYSQLLGRDVQVLKPPAWVEAEALSDGLTWPPQRYLLHFAGHLRLSKGTNMIARALPRVLDAVPDFAMFWLGRATPEYLHSLHEILGPARSTVAMLYPLAKPELYALISRAEAVVLPSLVDNIPNTVIESLLLDVPVIGTAGASIDEMMEHGVHGLLVEHDNDVELADAMIAAWNDTWSIKRPLSWAQSERGRSFQPDTALANFHSLVASVTRGTVKNN